MAIDPLPTLATEVIASGVTGDAGDAAPEWLTGAMLAAGVAIATAVLLRRWFRLLRRGPKETPRERIDRVTASRERDSLESLMVDVQELTRTCAAQIENRALRLEKLLELTDRRLAELSARGEAANTDPPGRRTDGPDLRVVRREPEGDAEDPLLRRVLALETEGRSASDIARLTKTPVGKVELMIRLHRRASA